MSGRLVKLTAVLMIVLWQGPAHAADNELASIDEQYNKLSHVERSNATKNSLERKRAIAGAYEYLFAEWRNPNRYVDLSTYDLQVLFLALAKVTTYSFDKANAEDMLKVLHALAAKNEANRAYYLIAHDALLNAKLLKEAGQVAFEGRAYDMPPTPAITSTTPESNKAPGELVVHQAKEELRFRAADMNRLEVIAITSPSCSPSRRALGDIHSDSELNNFFEAKGKWLAPMGELSDYPDIKRWNSEHPDQKMVISYDDEMWPFETWNTPTFYILENGKVKYKLEGWSEKQHSKMRTLLLPHSAG